MSKSDQLAQKFGANLAQTVSLRADAASRPIADRGRPGQVRGAVKSRAFAELPVSLVDRDESQPRGVRSRRPPPTGRSITGSVSSRRSGSGTTPTGDDGSCWSASVG